MIISIIDKMFSMVDIQNYLVNIKYRPITTRDEYNSNNAFSFNIMTFS